MGLPDLELVLCLFAAWVLIFLILMKGVQSIGKVVYFTSTFPYIILVILFVRGVTLPGAGKGVEFYMIPNISKLAEGRVWGDAAIQVSQRHARHKFYFFIYQM